MAVAYETERLILRPWKDSDLDPFARINADARVMEHFPTALTRGQSDLLAARIQTNLDRSGYGLWAVELKGSAPFIGFVGLSRPPWQAHFTPCVEVGWRLDPDHWNHGYATEGARRALRVGFETVGLDEVVSFTAPANLRSRRVMERLGMRYAEDFDHPAMPAGHHLRRHVLYRIRAGDVVGKKPPRNETR